MPFLSEEVLIVVGRKRKVSVCYGQNNVLGGIGTFHLECNGLFTNLNQMEVINAQGNS